MAATGGSIESISLDGRVFPVAADAEAQRKLGGFENEVQANGDGTARYIKTRVPWSVDGLTIEVDDDRGDHEFLQLLSNQSGDFPVAVTYPSGVTFQGMGQITGEMQVSSQSATASVNLMGSGVLTPQ
jgi:hypothetical protein